MRFWPGVVGVALLALSPLDVAGQTVDESTPCTAALSKQQLAPGLWLESQRPAIAPAVAAIEPCLWIVRFDPKRFPLELHTGPMSRAKTPAAWLSDAGLLAVINAAMYTPTGRPTGLTIDDGQVVHPRDHRAYSAFFAFGPKRKGLPLVKLVARGCPDFDLDGLVRDYQNVVQNYRMLDCSGKPIAWKDPKVYSVAAVALDRSGYVAFLHMRAPYRMSDFTRILADPALGFVAAMYVEGGSPAQLSLKVGTTQLQRRGVSLNFLGESDKLPNILGFRRAPSPAR